MMLSSKMFRTTTVVARSTLLIRNSAVPSTGLSGSRMLSTGPKMHKAKDMWVELQKTRPPKDHLDSHLVFHPPFNGFKIGIALVSVLFSGHFLFLFAIEHQQHKQGFWKK